MRFLIRNVPLHLTPLSRWGEETKVEASSLQGIVLSNLDSTL